MGRPFMNFKMSIKKQLQEQSQYFRSKKQSSNLIQSFMDYGSIICTPRNPHCSNCLIKLKCSSYKKNLQNIIPLKNKPSSKKKKKY